MPSLSLALPLSYTNSYIATILVLLKALRRLTFPHPSLFTGAAPRFSRLRQIHYFLIVNRQGKIRLAKWYTAHSSKERTKVVKELTLNIFSRLPEETNFVSSKNLMIVYRR